MKPDLAIVIPLYNEEEYLPTFCTEWQNALAGIPHVMLFCDDGSTDGGGKIIKDFAENAPTMKHLPAPNSGHGAACRRGYEAALETGAQFILQIDSDGQCLPEFFPEFWKQRETHDCVFGERIERGDGIARKITSELARISTNTVCGTKLKDPNCPFRLIRRDALEEALKLVPLDFEIQNVALKWALAQNPKNRWHHIPIRFPNRAKGTNSINLGKVARMGLEMIFQLRQLATSKPKATTPPNA